MSKFEIMEKNNSLYNAQNNIPIVMRVYLLFSSDKSMITYKNEKNKRVNLFSSLDDGMQIKSIPHCHEGIKQVKLKEDPLTRVEIHKHIDRSVLWCLY